MTTKKRLLSLLTLIALLTAGGVAYAFWTAGGSGTGTAATGSNVGLTAVQTSTVTNMYPGDAPQRLSGNFNNTNAGPVRVATVTASIASVTPAANAPAGTCNASDYTLANPIVTVGRDVPPGTGVSSWGATPDPTATIQFNNKTTNQDACKGATVNLAYTIQ